MTTRVMVTLVCGVGMGMLSLWLDVEVGYTVPFYLFGIAQERLDTWLRTKSQ